MLSTKISTVALAFAAVGLFSAGPALAQFKYETPDGHQTVAPSRMPQQPSLNEEFSHPSGKTVPNNEPDIPGIPNIQTRSTGAAPTTVPAKPGLIQDLPQPGEDTGGPPAAAQKAAQSSQAQSATQGPKAQATAPGATAQPGSIVLPQGESSTQRVGPVEPTPVWQRGVLAAWLLLQFFVMVVVAIAMKTREERDWNLFQGGHMINEDYREPVGGPPLAGRS